MWNGTKHKTRGRWSLWFKYRKFIKKDGSNGVTADSVKIVEHLMEGKTVAVQMQEAITSASEASLSHTKTTHQSTPLEDEYVRKMLAPSKAMVEDMFMHGADFDGSGHIR